MEKDYDLFERAPGRSLVWRARVHGLENARQKLEQLARNTSNECSVIYQPTRQVVALANIAQTKRVVFQVAYDEGELAERADLLQRRGYEVVSVSGNERAKVVLELRQRVDFFIVGQGEPEEERREIVAVVEEQLPENADSGVESGGTAGIGRGGFQRGTRWAGGVVVDGGCGGGMRRRETIPG